MKLRKHLLGQARSDELHLCKNEQAEKKRKSLVTMLDVFKKHERRNKREKTKEYQIKAEIKRILSKIMWNA